MFTWTFIKELLISIGLIGLFGSSIYVFTLMPRELAIGIFLTGVAGLLIAALHGLRMAFQYKDFFGRPFHFDDYER